MYLNLRHIGIVVNNLNENINFFRKYFKFKILNNQLEQGQTISTLLNIKNLKVRTVKMIGLDGNKIELLKFYNNKKKLSNKKIYSTGITHFAVSVKNVDMVYKELKKNNYKTISEPKLSDDGKVKLFFCKTKENIFIEIVEELDA